MKVYFLFISILINLNSKAQSDAIVVKDEDINFKIFRPDSCLNLESNLTFFFVISNTSTSDYLICTKNVIFDCDVTDADGNKLVANYNIAHSRDWSTEDCFLVKKQSEDTILYTVQKNRYFNLLKGKYYTFLLTYSNEQKNLKQVCGKYKHMKAFVGKRILNEITVLSCE